MSSKVCVVVGVGPGNGAAIARRFAAEGYAVALLARNAGYLQKLAAEFKDARPYVCDVTAEGEIETAFAAVREEMGPVEVLIYNAGAGRFSNLDDTTAQDLEHAWQINARGFMLASQHVVPDMRRHGGGSIIVIGATASWKGAADFLPFASAKAAQRSIAQSMARQLGPEHIHVACVIIDAIVDLETTRKMMPDEPDEFFIRPEDIADTVWFLARQAPSAWTFELDLRPFGERW